MGKHDGRPKFCYRHAIAAYDIVGIPSQIAYGGWKKTITQFHHGGHRTAI